MTSSSHHILITNDDGVSAAGLCALCDALSAIARVTVIAPNRNWSAAGHVKTMHKPLRADPVRMANGHQALATNGAPSDAVTLGLMGLAEGPVDLVISGINLGENVGHDVTYSGTVTAAMEGVINGVPAFAISLKDRSPTADFSAAADFAAFLALRVMTYGLPEKVLLNVNVPCGPAHAIRGVRVTRMGQRIYRDVLVRREDPYGRPYYWIGGDPPIGSEEEGTDFAALTQGFISITPIQLDFTAYDFLPRLEAWEGLLSWRSEPASVED